MVRRQLPVYSPVPWSAVAAGAAAAVRGDRGGELRQRLTDLLKSRYVARDVLLTDSGTSALRLAIAGGIGKSERPVALPGYSCYDVATAAEGAGARVALYDLNPLTLGPDAESLESLRSVRPAVLVVGHLFGHLVDVASVRESVGDALLIEDAAQGVGGKLHGRPLGALGSVSILSFGRGKGITGGGGGALLAHDDRGTAVLEWARTQCPPGEGTRGIARVAMLVGQLMLGRPALYRLPSSLPFLHLGETVYCEPRAPQRATAASLAVLARVMQVTDREALVRTRNAQRLESSMKRSIHLRPVEPVPGGEPGYLRLPAIVHGGERSALLAVMARSLGVTPGYPTTLATLPSLTGRLVGPEPWLPGSATLTKTLLTLPTHSLLTDRDLASIEEWMLRR